MTRRPTSLTRRTVGGWRSTGQPGLRIAAIAAALIVVVAVTAFITSQTRPQAAPTATSSLPPRFEPADSTTPTPSADPVRTAGAATPREDHGEDHGEGHGDEEGHDHAHDVDADAEKVWAPVVDNFGRNFTNASGGARQWLSRISGDPAQPQLTAALAKKMATVDISNVPDGRYEGYRPIEESPYQVDVKIDYDTGLALVLTLTTDGTYWQITDYQPLED